MFQAALRVVDNGLEKVGRVSDAIDKSLSPLPTEDTPAPNTSNGTSPSTAPASLPSKVIQGVRAQVKRGLPIPHPDAAYVESIVDGIRAKEGLSTGIDDRKKGLEEALTLLSRLPPEHSKGITHAAIRQLYYDLPHPAQTHVGSKYAFRSADGSGNNISDPTIGAAGTAYSRTCVGLHPQPKHQLPDPGLLFDTLLKRDEFVPHPAGLSSLFFHFATNVIHTVFRTSRNDYNINETSSYADLSTLYGNNQDQQDTVRNKSLGKGLLHEDVFAETRLLRLPPQVGIIMVLFNRNHNWIATKLLEINERGEWKNPPPTDSDLHKKQDEEIFQTARLINCVTFANVIMGDFLAAIMGTVRDGSSWTLDILSEYREKDGTLLERGKGNVCSVEFNVLYRFHQCMAPSDEKFIVDSFGYLFPGKHPEDITVEEFEKKITALTNAARSNRIPDSSGQSNGSYADAAKVQKTKEELERDAKDDSKPVDVTKLSIHGSNLAPLKRDPQTGRYDDAELAKYLQDGTAQPGGAFKANGVPEVMRVIEIMGIEQSRVWGTATLNEFRSFLGLKPYETFEEWNPDPNVANAARALYRHPDNIELYVGLAAEDSKPVGDGAGLCPSYTTSRALLADAISLVRGDRYLTVDLTPHNLTTWGFTECSRNTSNAGWGGMLGKILARTLPDHYDAYSVYTHFPLMTPESMEHTLKKIGKLDQYSLARPASSKAVTIVRSEELAKHALETNDYSRLRAPYASRAREIIEGRGFWTGADPGSVHAQQSLALVRDAAAGSKDGVGEQAGKFFYERTVGLINSRSYGVVKSPVRSVDLVQDVLKFVPLRWGATEVGGLPLKASSASHGIWYEGEIYKMLENVYSFVYLTPETTLYIPERNQAKDDADRLLNFIKGTLQQAKGGITAGLVGVVVDFLLRDEHDGAAALAAKLTKSGQPIDALANDLLAIIATASVELPQIFAHVINFYLDPARKEHADEIRKLVKSDDAQSTRSLIGYIKEALRFDPVVPVVRREALQDGEIRDGNESLSYTAGSTLAFSLSKIAFDSDIYPDPQRVDPNRNTSYEAIQGDRAFHVLGADFVYQTTAQVIRAIFQLKNVRLADPRGLTRAAVSIDDTKHYLYQDAAQRLTPWANSLMISYDQF